MYRPYAIHLENFQGTLISHSLHTIFLFFNILSLYSFFSSFFSFPSFLFLFLFPLFNTFLFFLFSFLGEHDQTVEEGAEKLIDVAAVCYHEGFSMKHIQNDIALLTLAKPVVLSDRINTVCLPQQSRQVPAGTNCYITGSQSKSCTHVMNITLAVELGYLFLFEIWERVRIYQETWKILKFCNATLACKNINFLYNQFSRDGETLNQSIAFVTGANMKTFRVRIVEKG